MRSDPPIVHIVPSEPWGGIQTLVPVLAREQIRQGHSVRLLCLGPGRRLREVAKAYGVETVPISFAGWRAPIRLLIEIVRVRGSILHSHCEPVWAAVILSAASLVARRWVSHAHVFPDNEMTWKSRLGWWLTRTFARRQIAISHAVARALLETGVARPATLDTVHNGVQTDTSDATARSAGSGLCVGFVGRAVAEKGLFEFIELAALLVDEPDFSFSIYGEGSDLAAAKASAAALGLEDRITFHGYVEDIATAWSMIDIAIVLSRREPFGLVFLEAALHGVASISYDNQSGGSEIAATLSTAHRVAPGDLPAAAAMLRTLSADRSLIVAGLAQDRATIAARYDIATMARGVAASYARLEPQHRADLITAP